MVMQMMPTITEVLNTCNHGQPRSPCLLSCALREALLIRREKYEETALHLFCLLFHFMLKFLLQRVNTLKRYLLTIVTLILLLYLLCKKSYKLLKHSLLTHSMLVATVIRKYC